MVPLKKSGREVAESATNHTCDISQKKKFSLFFCNVVGMQMHNTYLSVRFHWLSPRSPLLNDLNTFHLCIIGSTPLIRYTSCFCFCAGLFCIVPAVFLFHFCKIFCFLLYFSLLSNSVLLWIPWRFEKAPKTANICVFCSPKSECSHSPIDLL